MKNKSKKTIGLVKKLNELLKKSVENKVFPGGAVGITIFSEKIRETVFLSFGNMDYTNSNKKTDISTFYDIASLTKPLATTLSILTLIRKRVLNFDSTLEELLGNVVPKDKKNINLYSLLNHSSGLPAYKPYYTDLSVIDYNKEKYDIVEKILKEPLEYETSTQQLYSDLGFLLLGKIVEKKSQSKLDDFSNTYIYNPLGISNNIFFDTLAQKDAVYAPTENCEWRKKTVCGQVHDDNAYALGGACGHAGLFANIFGVTDLVNSIIDIVKGRKEFSTIRREDLIRCVTRQSNIGSWGLGFDTPSDLSSSGRFFSKNSFGHLGFTGTSFWADLDKDISIVLLTNRVNPNRENSKIKKFRPLFHDLIMEMLLE